MHSINLDIMHISIFSVIHIRALIPIPTVISQMKNASGTLPIITYDQKPFSNTTFIEHKHNCLSKHSLVPSLPSPPRPKKKGTFFDFQKAVIELMMYQ